MFRSVNVLPLYVATRSARPIQFPQTSNCIGQRGTAIQCTQHTASERGNIDTHIQFTLIFFMSILALVGTRMCRFLAFF